MSGIYLPTNIAYCPECFWNGSREDISSLPTDYCLAPGEQMPAGRCPVCDGNAFLKEGIDLMDILNKALTEPIIKPIKPIIGLYPSSASIVINGEIIGGCNRKSFWALQETTISDAPSGNAEMNMALGNATHDLVVSLLKNERVYIAHEVPIYCKDTGVSGRPDIFVTSPVSREIIGVEVKSVHGHYGRSGVIEVHRGVTFAPKTEHVLQAMIYLDFYSQFGIEDWIILYVARDNGFRAQHWINLREVEGEWISHRTGAHKKNKAVVINGTLHPELTTKGIYERFTELDKSLTLGRLPERDYVLQYSKEVLESMAESGKLNKTETEKVKKGKFVEKGNWNCSYCSYKSRCWNGITKQDLYEGRLDKSSSERPWNESEPVRNSQDEEQAEENS